MSKNLHALCIGEWGEEVENRRFGPVSVVDPPIRHVYIALTLIHIRVSL